MTGVYDGKLGTKRFCSSKDWGNYCEYIERPGGEFEFFTGYYFCKVFELQQSNQGYRESLGVKEVQINAKRKYSTELFWRNLILKFTL